MERTQATVTTTATPKTCPVQANGSPTTTTCTCTSHDGTEGSAPTSSTCDEERSQAPSVDLDVATPPTTPSKIHASAEEEDRQPPSPLAAAADQQVPLVPYLSSQPDDGNQDVRKGAAKSQAAVDGILVVGSPQDGPTHHCPTHHHRRRRRRRPRRNVTFTTLTVHHHPHTLGDHPAVSDGGVPLGLAWTAIHTDVHDIDDYESNRHMAGNERRSVHQLRMNGAKRRMLLLKVGHTDEEMEEMMAEVRRVQMHRARAAAMGGSYGIIGGTWFDMGSKTRMVRDVGTKAKRQVGKVVGAMEKATTIRIQPIGRSVLEFGQVDGGGGEFAPADP